MLLRVMKGRFIRGDLGGSTHETQSQLGKGKIPIQPENEKSMPLCFDSETLAVVATSRIIRETSCPVKLPRKIVFISCWDLGSVELLLIRFIIVRQDGTSV